MIDRGLAVDAAGWTGARLALLLLSLVCVAAVAVAPGCGEATDSPEDCTEAEYFDEANEQCVACPAVVAPQCRPGCGFYIVEDERRGCPVAECAVECLCEQGQFFSDESLACESCDGAVDPPRLCFDDQEADDS
jgi:hypothetical protein